MADPLSWSRRALLAGTGLSVASLVLPAGAFAQDRQPANTTADGFRLLRARPAKVHLLGEGQPATAIWGYEGAVPGPLLRVRRGQEIKARLINELPEPTAIHWHGVRTPNGMDGVPHLTQTPVAPGATFDYRFTARDAGTFWYHAPLATPGQAERGLYGVLLVDEPEPASVDRDVVLLFNDWVFTVDGVLETAAAENPKGLQWTVNNQPQLDIPVRTNERIRLRLINAATFRLAAVRIDGHATTVVAFDGQPAEPFVTRDSRVVLGPGNRADLIIDAGLRPGATAAVTLETTQGPVPIARLVYDRAPASTTERGEPRQLPANPLPGRMDFARAIKLDIPLERDATRAQVRAPGGGAAPASGDPRAPVWVPAGEIAAGKPGAALFTVRPGRVVMLAFVNRSEFPHAVHVHGHSFRLLDALDDGWKPFWLDTVLVPPQQTVRIAFAADNPGKWLLDRRMLEAPTPEGVSTWFEVA